MILIEFLGNELGPAVSARAEPLAALVDVCDEIRAPVSFSCRSASCGTCRVDVLEGEDLLEPPSPEEAEVLDVFDAKPGTRLACTTKLRAGVGRLLLRWSGDT